MRGAGVPVGVLVHIKLKQEQDQFQGGSSLPAVWLGPGWSLEDLGWADVTGLVGQRALDKAGAAQESPHIRLRQV